MSGPVLQTARMVLSPPALGDLPGFHACYASPEAARFLGGQPSSIADSFGRLLRGAGSWSLYGYGMFHLRLRGQDEIVGACGVFHSWRGYGQVMDDVAEAGWAIRPDRWGKGLAGEAMTEILAWFDAERGPARTVCMIEQGHEASERLAVRLGYRAFSQYTAPDDALLLLYERESGK